MNLVLMFRGTVLYTMIKFLDSYRLQYLHETNAYYLKNLHILSLQEDLKYFIVPKEG